MSQTDIFKNYYKNPNKKFIDSGVICPGCDDKSNHKLKIDDSSLVDTNGTDTKPLMNLGDVESPINEVESNTTTVTPNSTVPIDGTTKGPQIKKSYFSLSPHFGDDASDPKFTDGIPFNTDIEFDLFVPGWNDKERIRFEADKENKRPYSIIDQINDYFTCIGVPIEVELASEEIDENLCSKLDQSDHQKCINYIKNKGKEKKKKLLPFLLFKSTVIGYDFYISNVVIYQKYLSPEYPTSPFIIEEINPEGIIEKRIPYNIIFDSIKETKEKIVDEKTNEEFDLNKVRTTPAVYKIKLDRKTGEVVERIPMEFVVTYKDSENKVYIFESECLSQKAHLYETEVSVSYTVKIKYPSTVDATDQFVWIRHALPESEMKKQFADYNKNRTENNLPLVSYSKWYKIWEQETIKEGYWIPVNTLYMVIGTKSKMINPVLINNPNKFNIQVEVIKHN